MQNPDILAKHMVAEMAHKRSIRESKERNERIL
jgi:hypothetical protein